MWHFCNDRQRPTPVPSFGRLLISIVQAAKLRATECDRRPDMVIEADPTRAEARRMRTLSGMRAALLAIGADLQRIGTLGDRAARALDRLAMHLRAQVNRADDLAEEFEILA